jgi:hypothetical protein
MEVAQPVLVRCNQKLMKSQAAPGLRREPGETGRQIDALAAPSQRDGAAGRDAARHFLGRRIPKGLDIDAKSIACIDPAPAVRAASISTSCSKK